MGLRWRALVGVVLLVGVIAGAPALAAPAAAEPRTVTVSIAPMPPFVMAVGDGWTGFTIDLWAEISKRQGWTTRWIVDDSPDEQLQTIAAGEADVAASALTVTSERTARFDFSQPFFDAGLQIMVPARTPADTSPGIVDFLKLLFSKTMLTFLMVALVVTIVPAHLVWLVERRHADPSVSRSYFPGIFNAYGWGLASLAAQGDSSPRHWIGRSIAIVWAFVAIIFAAFYTANLTSALTVQRLDTQIKGPADLYDKAVCTVAGTTAVQYLQSIDVAATEVTAIDECYDGLREDRFDAVVFDSPVLRYYIAHTGAGVAATTGPVFDDDDYGFAMSRDNPLRQPIDQTLLEIREDGTYDAIVKKWLGDSVSDTAG
ncbi:transporter substrate-binding domain-containing protein [Mycobacterium sp. WMMD1722]|uniref:transporter substrate-binding domain-containing protein n=1 Tax=Mycobacterium sp. WMMD1722 TaxID=3404117 RepID=UPI003BF5CCEE